MKRGPDAAVLLVRALEESARRSAIDLGVVRSDAVRWASATFAGMRHTLTLTMPRSLDADSWVGELEDADLPLRGHLVADLVVATIRRDAECVTIEIEALTVES